MRVNFSLFFFVCVVVAVSLLLCFVYLFYAYTISNAFFWVDIVLVS